MDKSDPIAGSAYDWVSGLSGHFRKIDVICLRKGVSELPSNVRVFSLGKETGRWKPLQALLYYYQAIRSLPRTDFVFCQFSSVFVITIYPLAWLFRRPIYMWWCHKHTDWKLRLALRLSRRVFTATEETFPIRSPKVSCIGLGIDTDKFVPRDELRREGPFRLVTIGRVSPVKKLEVMIEACAELARKHPHVPFTLDVIGGGWKKADEEYFDRLRVAVSSAGLGNRVHFQGKKPYSDVPAFHRSADCFLNTCETGGTDKAILEAMSSGLPIVTTNQAMREVLGATLSDAWVVEAGSGQAAAIADRIARIYTMSEESRRALGGDLREIIRQRWSIQGLCQSIRRIVTESA
jgi:glycosyltransferase involved in cell wall biosynthesis